MEKWLMAVCVLGLVGIGFVCIRDSRRFHKVKYQIVSSKIQKRYRFVLFSDLHNKTYGKNHAKLMRAIEEEKPDAIFLAGDILTAKPGKRTDIAADLINQLKRQWPVYYGYGNHEYRLCLYPETYGSMHEDYQKQIVGGNLFLLRNAHTVIRSNAIQVTGVEIGKEYYQRCQKNYMDVKYLERLLGKPDEDLFQIVIAHHPDYFESYAKWGADLVLSGHVHGGMARIPFLGGVISPSLQLFPKYDGGRFESEGSTMILSRGLGMHTIPIRFFNPGEVIIVDLEPKS